MPSKIPPVVTWQIGASSSADPLAPAGTGPSPRARAVDGPPTPQPVSLAARSKSLPSGANARRAHAGPDSRAAGLLAQLAQLRMPGSADHPPPHIAQRLARYLASRLRQADDPSLRALADSIDTVPNGMDNLGAEAVHGGTMLPPPLRDAVDRLIPLEVHGGDVAVPYHVTLHRAPPGAAERLTRAGNAMADDATAGHAPWQQLLAAAGGNERVARRIACLGNQDPHTLLVELYAHWDDPQGIPIRLLLAHPQQIEQHVQVAALPDGGCRIVFSGTAHGISQGADEHGQAVLLDPELSHYAYQMSYTAAPDGTVRFDDSIQLDCTAVRIAPVATIPTGELAQLEHLNRAFPAMARMRLDPDEPDHATLYARDRLLNAVRDRTADVSGVITAFRDFVEQLAASAAPASPAITASLPEALHLLQARLAGAGAALSPAQRRELADRAEHLGRLSAQSLSVAWQALIGDIVQTCRIQHN